MEIGEVENNIAILKASQQEAIDNVQIIDDLLQETVEQITNPEFINILYTAIDDERKELIDLRENKSNYEFTEEKYPEHNIFTRGIKKNNLGYYFLFVNEINNIIRNSITSCKEKMVGNIDNFINRIVTMLHHRALDDSMRKTFENVLKSAIIQRINGIPIIIEKEMTLDKPLTGNMRQYLLYRRHFECEYSDSWINEILNRFSIITEYFSKEVEGDARIAISNIKKKVQKSTSLNPQQKQEEIDKENQKLEGLQKELENVEKDICLISK